MIFELPFNKENLNVPYSELVEDFFTHGIYHTNVGMSSHLLYCNPGSPAQAPSWCTQFTNQAHSCLRLMTPTPLTLQQPITVVFLLPAWNTQYMTHDWWKDLGFLLILDTNSQESLWLSLITALNLLHKAYLLVGNSAEQEQTILEKLMGASPPCPSTTQLQLQHLLSSKDYFTYSNSL